MVTICILVLYRLLFGTILLFTISRPKDTFSSMAHHYTAGDYQPLANDTNSFLKAFRLINHLYLRLKTDIQDTHTIAVSEVERQLMQMKAGKADKARRHPGLDASRPRAHTGTSNDSYFQLLDQRRIRPRKLEKAQS